MLMSRKSPPTLTDEIEQSRPFASPEVEAYLNLVRTHAVLSDQFNRLFRTAGLSQPKYNALRILVGAGKEGLPSQTIGRRMVVRDPDCTRLVDRLESDGLVSRAKSTEDRRVTLVRVTPAGRRKVRGLEKRLHELHLSQLGHLTAEELGTLSELLTKARQPIDD
jgi:DNA-binding MarR family transcriptional regulator